jgi:threonine/homoserine/homoserine lactone efflux protein
VWVVGQFASAFLLGLTGAMMPGPMMTVTAQHSASLGWLAGPTVVAGHAVLETAMVSAIGVGAARFLTEPVFAGAVGLIGGLVLVFMGIGVVRAAGTAHLDANSGSSRGAQPGRSSRAFLSAGIAGTVTSLSNPYWVIWWGTVGAGHVALALRTSGAAGVAAFFTGHLSADLTWYAVLAAVMATGGKRLPQAALGMTLRVLGVFMVAMACYFIYSGVGFLIGAS